mgnify:CR=1 FL=1
MHIQGIIMDRPGLHNMYNGTLGLNEETKDLETYEYWLERQLISRIHRLEKLDKLAEYLKMDIEAGNFDLDHPSVAKDAYLKLLKDYEKS